MKRVLLPYKFTLLSNRSLKLYGQMRFYYPINLHYSQTRVGDVLALKPFYYPINLHYSQTTLTPIAPRMGFTTL